MVILHVCDLDNNMASGMRVVVPEHVKALARLEQSKCINLQGVDMELGELQLSCDSNKIIDSLAPPYNHPDIVVFHGVNSIRYIPLYKDLLQRKIKYVIVPHGQISKVALRKKWLKKKIAYILWFNKFVNNAKGIQCLSQREREDIVGFRPQKFIGTNGIALSDYTKDNFAKEGMSLFYIGRLEIVVKGLDRMLEAMNIIQDYARNNKITLHIYGPDDGYKKPLKQLCSRYGIDDIVTIMPPVFKEEKLVAVRNHDIFIQTSRTEGMPMGILEMMSYGVPCILTEGTTLAGEVAQSYCGYNAKDSAKDIAEQIVLANEDKANWVQKGSKSKEHIANNYCWNKVVQDIIKEYKEV